MTKLKQWLFGLTLFLSVWLGILKNLSPINVSDENIVWIYLVKNYKQINMILK